MDFEQKLSRVLTLESGHWVPYSKHPGLDKGKKRQVKKRGRELSFLLHPSDRDKFVKWGWE